MGDKAVLDSATLDTPIQDNYWNFYQLGPYMIVIYGPSAVRGNVQVSVRDEEWDIYKEYFPTGTTPRQIQGKMAEWALNQYKEWVDEANKFKHSAWEAKHDGFPV